MTQIVADAGQAKLIEAADGPVQVVDDKGTVIGVCTPIKFPHSPYSREEVEKARKQCRESGGKPLADILARLREQHS